MNISLHWQDTSTLLRNATDGALPYKKQLGHISATLSTRLDLGKFPSKINLNWKKNLASKLTGSKFRAGVPCTVQAGNYKFQINGQRTREDFANRVANLILRSNHEYKNSLSNVSKDSIKKSLGIK